MRTRSSLVALSFTILVGCTSLLGDFEVGPGGGTTGCGDVQTDRDNCGTCGNVCGTGLSCTAGVCGCAADEALCGGACAKASRTACGPTCTACQDDEVCSSGCVPAPDPDFARKPEPFGATGWTTGGGPLELEVKTLNVPGVIYECRTGPVSVRDPVTPAWGNCDGAAGTGTVHRPTELAGTPEGTYFTEHRYRSDTYRSKTVSTEYYVHHALDAAQRCPRSSVPNDVPRLTDQQYFDAANLFAASNQPTFPNTTQFPPEGLDKNADVFLHSPFISVRFQAVERSASMAAPDFWDNNNQSIGWPLAGANYDLNERTLRHKYVLNTNRTLLIYKRVFTHPTRNDCKDTYTIGNNLAGNYGPADANRGTKKIDCEAFVLNARGNALCLVTRADAAGAEPVPVDRLPQNYLTGGGTLTINVATPNQVTMVGGNLNANTYIQIPRSTGPGTPSYWYRVVNATNMGGNVVLTLSENSKTTGTGLTWAWSPLALRGNPVIRTGYAKLHQPDGHLYSDGLVNPRRPSPRTKCETVDCNKCDSFPSVSCPSATRPWLTYLPP